MDVDPPSKPPTPPRPKITGLPDLGDDESNDQLPELDVDFSSMHPQPEIYDLDQFLYDESMPNRPLIDEIVPMSQLREEYEKGSPSFVQQIDWLQNQGYEALRRTKGDGDCFYRSTAFAYVERLMQDPDPELAVGRACSILEATLPSFDSVGFEATAYEDFYNALYVLIRDITNPDVGKKVTPNRLLEAFQDYEVSNSIVVYMRLVTSAQIRLNGEEFGGFLMHPETGEPMEADKFCESFVEASGKEADHVQMTALCRALKLNIHVAYLDGRGKNGVVDFVPIQYGDEKDKPLMLLYRPGHYDILVAPTA